MLNTLPWHMDRCVCVCVIGVDVGGVYDWCGHPTHIHVLQSVYVYTQQPPNTPQTHTQVVADYRAGLYPTLSPDTPRLTALQLVIHHGSTFVGGSTTRKVGGSTTTNSTPSDDTYGMMKQAVQSYIPNALVQSRSTKEWVGEIMSHYDALADLTAAECQLLFLSAVGKVAYGMC